MHCINTRRLLADRSGPVLMSSGAGVHGPLLDAVVVIYAYLVFFIHAMLVLFAFTALSSTHTYYHYWMQL